MRFRSFGALLQRMLATSMLLASGAQLASAQQSTGTILGRVTDSALASIGAALIHVDGTTLGASSGTAGDFTIERIMPGSYTVTVRRKGYSANSFSVAIHAGEVVTRSVILRAAAQFPDA